MQIFHFELKMMIPYNLAFLNNLHLTINLSPLHSGNYSLTIPLCHVPQTHEFCIQGTQIKCIPECRLHHFQYHPWLGVLNSMFLKLLKLSDLQPLTESTELTSCIYRIDIQRVMRVMYFFTCRFFNYCRSLYVDIIYFKICCKT